MITVHPKRIRTISLSLGAVALLTLLGVFAGCGSDAPVATVAPPQVTAQEAVELSKSAMGNLDSFSFELTHDSGFTTLSSSLELTRASGIVSQGGLDLEAEANIGRAFVRVEAIVIDEQTWMTNPLTGVWSEIPPEDSPFSFLDPVKLVADILGETQGPFFGGLLGSGGEITVTGKIPATTLAALVGRVDPDAVPDVVLTIDSSDYLLNKIIISGNVQPEDEPDTIRVITLSEFDKPVSLEPPI
jgi:hypothetical protein